MLLQNDKIYYCKVTGKVIRIMCNMFNVKNTTFDEDYSSYKDLNERVKETIGLIQIEYGQYAILSKNSTGVMVDLESKELIFTYEEIPQPPQEPTWEEQVDNKISILQEQNANLLLDNAKKEIEINGLNKNLANVTLEIAKIKGGM